MANGCRIMLELDVSVDEMVLLQKRWKAAGVRSLEEHVLKMLLAEVPAERPLPIHAREGKPEGGF